MTINNRSHRTLIACLVALIGVVACSEDKPAPEKASTIGAAGGVVKSDDGLLVVDIPAGAVANDLEISITKATGVPSGHLGTAYELGPSGTMFAKSVALTFSYSGVDLGELQPEQLVVQTVINGKWVPVPLGDLDQEAKTITGLVPHFSQYAMGSAQPIPAQGEPDDPCLCNTSVWTECCQTSGPENPALSSSWVTIASPGICGCANASWYNLFRCYEQKAGYEFGGCTACEDDCCHKNGGFNTASDGVCFCSRAAADSCMATCTASGQDKTKCEQQGGGPGPAPDQGVTPDPDQGVTPAPDQGSLDAGAVPDQPVAILDAGVCDVACDTIAPGGSWCNNCSSTCGGHLYQVSCSPADGSCTCTTDGAVTGNPTVTCSNPSAMSTAMSACGFPGQDGPAPDQGLEDASPVLDQGPPDTSTASDQPVLPPDTGVCDVACDAVAPGGSSCNNCSSTCGGHLYHVSCSPADGSCTCTIDGAVTGNPTVTCSNLSAMSLAWSACGYPGP